MKKLLLSQYLEYLRTLEGKFIDEDNLYGSQCVDLIKHVYARYFNFISWGNAIDYAHNQMPLGAIRHRVNHKDFNIQKGDILITHKGVWDKYGHIFIVLDTHGNNVFTIAETNPYGDLTKGGAMRIIKKPIYNIVARIRLPFINDLKDNFKVNEEYGEFIVTTDVLNVRDYPSVKSGKVVAQYLRGEKLWYNGYIFHEGYVWLRYTALSGETRYIASGRHLLGNRNSREYGYFR